MHEGKRISPAQGAYQLALVLNWCILHSHTDIDSPAVSKANMVNRLENNSIAKVLLTCRLFACLYIMV